MEPKTYGLETLALIVAGRTGATDKHGWSDALHKATLPRSETDVKKSRYEVRDGGLWRNSKAGAAVGTPMAERDVLEWQPVASEAKPALPIPFTACEFAAFTLAGLGAMVIERFEDDEDEDEDALSDAAIGALGRNGADAKEVLREAHRLRLEAIQRFGHNIAKEAEPLCNVLDDAETDKAAAWLLNDAHRELDGKGHPAAGLTLLMAAGSPAPAPDAQAEPAPSQTQARERRQDARLASCELMGLVFDGSARLPDGVGIAAVKLGITRQSLSVDLRSAVTRRSDGRKNGIR